jgi:hypothetical protein
MLIFPKKEAIITEKGAKNTKFDEKKVGAKVGKRDALSC